VDVKHPAAADLARIPLLAGLPDEARQVLSERFEIEDFGTGQRLVTEGRSGYAFYVLDRGHASVAHEGHEVRRLGPGDFFGEIAILGAGRRTATVTATEPGTMWTLFGTSFRMLEADRPEVASALQDAMTERLAADRDDTSDTSQSFRTPADAD
jgi:CRP-like cAMP-binding protein